MEEDHNPRAEQSWLSSQNLKEDNPYFENLIMLAIFVAFITYIIPGGY